VEQDNELPDVAWLTMAEKPWMMRYGEWHEARVVDSGEVMYRKNGVDRALVKELIEAMDTYHHCMDTDNHFKLVDARKALVEKL